ncbi:MAG: cellulase family glycosylhydrolase [Pseudomonadota bacterium]|nr:cellulase family glycosylhydrolase [Pseudomonadota bacterium]
MPPEDQDLGSSEPATVTATPIAAEALPFTKARRIYDMGAHMAPLLHKRAEDTLDYFISLERFLEEGEEVTGARGSLCPQTTIPLIMHRLEFAPRGVLVWLTAGAHNERYEVHVLVETSWGKEKLYRFNIITRGRADFELPEPPITVTIEPIPFGVGMAGEGEIPDEEGEGQLTLSRASLNFGELVEGELSLTQTFFARNTGTAPINLYSITVDGDYIVSSDSTGRIMPGEEVTVSVAFAPSRVGTRNGTVTIDGAQVGTVALLGSAIADPTALPDASVDDGILTDEDITASVDDGILSEDDITASVGDGEVGEGVAAPSLTPAALELTALLGESASKVATLANIGGDVLTIEEIAVSAGFTQTNDCGDSLAPGATCSITVTHTPAALGATDGTLEVTTDVGSVSSSVAGSGTAEETEPEEPVALLGPLSTSGNQFVDADGEPVRLRSVNWFGAESENNFPHGIWANGYKVIIDQIAAWGFNCVRVPFSGDTFRAGKVINGVTDEFAENFDFITGGEAPFYTYVTPFEALDLIIQYAATKGLYIVLDHHRRAAGAGADGSPIGGGYSQADWLATWASVADHYKDFPNVIGADVHNEPHDLDWNTWAGHAEACGAQIHAIAPHWIIFVEGVGSYDNDPYWWGGQLAGVATRPVVLTVANKLAYSPHEYGQSVGNQQWLRYDSNPSQPANYPANLYQVWTDHWGFIFEQNIAPIWIGEFGGKYGVDGSGNQTEPHGTYEKQWTTELGKYLAGDFTGSGSSSLPAGKLGASFAYWSLNPNSGDTGGLLQDDWSTPQAVKIDLLAPFLAQE